MNDEPELTEFPESVHILGIGGAGMSALARLLLARGVRVSGSDAKDSRRVDALRALGAQCTIGHDPANLGDAGAVIVSTAIGESNVELRAARQRGIPVLHRSLALAMATAGSRVLAVAGTHGKTTTTSMLTVILQACGQDPSFAIGSELHDSGSNAHLGTGDTFVVEADESDGSFLRLDSAVGIITNVEPDHLNYWGTAEAMEAGFREFAAGVGRRGGYLVVCADDPGAARLAGEVRNAGGDVRTYGRSAGSDYRITIEDLAASGSRFRIRGPLLDDVACHVRVPGLHNVLNATAAAVAAAGMGLAAGDVADGVEQFVGTRRRFEYRGEVGGVRVFDDYAHHPTEIAATLRAARDVVGTGRIRVAFQAHHYYRTAMYLQQFGESLGLADFVVVLEVFAPGEEPIPGASGQGMADAVPLPRDQVVFEPSWSAVAGHLASGAQPGDIIMTLGAGDISLLIPEVLDLLASRFDEVGP
ncbi:MAG TPA: UDP-N-acetylmuramate--L-alanine ligase [Actinomycetota bacterium]|nr:UDP-N-acetylmuramate--L-alanine ligase [Actinomycetota bacterium]